MRGTHVSSADRLEEGVDELLLAREVAGRRCAGHDAMDPGEVLGPAEFVGVLTEEDDRIARRGEGETCGVRGVVEHADHADRGRGVDRALRILVVE